MKRYARIYSYLRRYPRQVAGYLVCMVLTIFFGTVSLGMLMPFLTLIFEGRELPAAKNPVTSALNAMLQSFVSGESKLGVLLVICVLIIVSILLKNVFLVLSLYILNPLKNKLVNALRTDLYQKILSLPIGYFTDQRKGDLVSRITNDVNEVEASVIAMLEGWVRDPLTIVFNLTVLFLLSPQLTLFLLLLIPVMGFVIGRITRSLKRGSTKVAEHQSLALSILDETLTGMRVIKAFNAEGLLRGRFLRTNDDLLAAKNRVGRRRDLASPASEFMGILMFCCILYFGGRLVLAGGPDAPLDAASFITYLALFYNVINPAKSLSTSFSNMQKGSAAIERIEEVLNTTNTVDENLGGKTLDEFRDAIELRNVSFAYGDVTILKDINLRIPKGNTVALVGASGAGKSTLADLIPRFHDATGGQLLIDGVDIRDYNLRSVRAHMSIVTQEPILFNDTVAANIRLGKPEATDAEVETAATVANAHRFIAAKEAGYATTVGDRGSKLSGGERQRTTIARAVLKNPPILILDEATSSLDTESERLVQDAINNLMRDRTTIVIAHRLSTIRHADEIVVLQRGEIVERGTHDVLMQQGGYYRKLIEMQEVR